MIAAIPTSARCPACGRDSETSTGCVLCKAAIDSWAYLVTTKAGHQFVCSEISFVGNGWLHLRAGEGGYFDSAGPEVIELKGRGLMMHISAIAYLEDADS